MSEEIKEMTNEEAMKALGEFATMCYNKGTQDVLIGVSIGARFKASRAMVQALFVLRVKIIGYYERR